MASGNRRINIYIVDIHSTNLQIKITLYIYVFKCIQSIDSYLLNQYQQWIKINDM
jgi:hypothetical protein